MALLGQGQSGVGGDSQFLVIGHLPSFPPLVSPLCFRGQVRADSCPSQHWVALVILSWGFAHEARGVSEEPSSTIILDELVGAAVCVHEYLYGVRMAACLDDDMHV